MEGQSLTEALLGPAGGTFLSHLWLARQGEETVPELANILACTWGAHAHTSTPGLTPGSRQASFRLTEQEKEAARDHTLGGEGSHLRITLSRKAAQEHTDTSTGSKHTGHYQGHQHSTITSHH